MNHTWWVNKGQLDEDQLKIIDLPLGGRHLVTGPPGCGKTNLLLLRANYISRSDHPKVLVVVFTRTLREFIVAGATKYAFGSDRVRTNNWWMYEFLTEFGGTKPSFKDATPFEERRMGLIEAVSDVISRRGLRNVYDAVLVDEAQDYIPEELELFGRLSPSLFLTADSRQKIYDTGKAESALEKLNCTSHPLTFHYRNGLQICKYADAIASHLVDHQPLTEGCNYNELDKPSSVQHVKCDTEEDQSSKLIAALSTQLVAYPGELLGVLCPRNEDVDAVYAEISASRIGRFAVKQSFKDKYVPFADETRICVSTIHSAKGLEFRAAHLVGLRHLPTSFARNVVFTAVTRAKTSLSVYDHGGLPRFVEGAYASIQPPKNKLDLSAAFGE